MRILGRFTSPVRWRRTAAAAVAAGLACALVAGCAGGGTTGQSGAKTITVAQSADIITMDPAMHRSRINQTVVRNVFEALVNQDASLKPVPELATEWTQVDPLTWRFKLRENVVFHNGEPFTAEAVKFSIERVLDPEQASPRASMLSMIDEVVVEDEHTVVIRTKQPSPILLASLSVNEIVPPKYLEEVGDEEFARKPVGTGPFTFVEWVANERVVLKANDRYWGGRPKVDRLIFRPIPEVSARIAALQSGDVQIAAEVPADLAGTLSGDVQAVSVSGTRIFFLAMNVTKAPFDKPEVRVAVNQAIDRELLVKSIYQDRARSLNQPAFPEMVGYHEGYSGYPYDKQAAGAVLGSIGTPVQIDVEEKDKTLAEAVAGQLQAAGLKAQVNVLEGQAFLDAINKGGSTAYLSSWGVAEGDADVIFARHFWSPSRKDGFYTGYRDAALDTLIEKARSTADQAERERLYAEAVEIVMAAAPWAPLLNPEEIYGVSAAVQGWQPSPIGRINVTDVTLK
ncbi:MAG TPA: ABC transporter substrate-binding protein [Micromonosporaceae bacterium]